MPDNVAAASPDVHVVSAGTALPGPAIATARLARQFGLDRQWEQWVDAFIGIRSRHLVVDMDTNKVRYSLTDLGTTAATRALDRAGLQPADVDLVVMSTAGPDMLLPTTANMIADRLGIAGVPAYQLQAGCSGSFQALEVARQLLLTGLHRTALVIGGDLCAKHYDLGSDLSDVPPPLLVGIMLFGDGAGAAVLTTEPARGTPVLRGAFTRLPDQHREPGMTVQWLPGADYPAVHEDYKTIEALLPGMAAEILKELLDGHGWTEADITYLLPPQLSGRITAQIVDQLGLPDAEELSCVRDTANVGNALIFLQLEQALARMSAGDRAVGIAVESSKWIRAGLALEGT
jgi:3-oxoacyl-[acyl-carrier-protein] synthase III